ncbi:MAG: CRISPR-associated protein Cas5, partial [Anaerolineae bacterium]
MDLLSLVLTLRPERRASLPPRLGRASHAILLDRLAAYDADLATALHDSHGPKPYTCSDLMGSRQDGDVFPEV